MFLIKKSYAISTLALLLALATGQSQTPVKVVLLGGQSNMDGWAYAQFLPTNLQNPQTDVLFFNGSQSAGNPSTLGSLRPNSVHGSDITFGPEITFGRAMEDAHPADQYALIKYSQGGTSLATDWNPSTGATYSAFKATVTSGLASLTNAGYAPQIIGMLWLQGENDSASLLQANAYEQNMRNFIIDIRSNYGNTLPFVIGGMGYANDPSYRDTVLTAQANVAATMTNVRFFSDDDLNPNHVLHFGTAEMQMIGQRFATNLNAIPEPNTWAMVLGGIGTLIGFQETAVVNSLNLIRLFHVPLSNAEGVRQRGQRGT
ncbi:MAG: sialate O-acetylesterase [Verrucomicrobiota bacterium]